MAARTVPQRLSDATLARVPPGIAVPAYARAGLVPGIVHFGPGAFHRAHQAVYADGALAACRDLAICAVSLRSAGLRDALAPQDGLYTLAVADVESSFRVIGSIRELLVAPESPAAVCDRLADPCVHTVTMTITEKGYCLDSSGNLDTAHPDIRADLVTPDAPRSAIGYVVAGLRRRRDASQPPFAVVSCDNQSENGTRLGNAVRQFAREIDLGLAAWIEDEVAFPLTMVDSITPATDAATRDAVRAALGLDDAWPVRRESFTQWVVESGCVPLEAAWADAGVTFDRDVRGYELAKLRLLNGQHSALAYLGVLAGCGTVAEAVADPDLRAFIDALAGTEIRPSIRAPEHLDLDGYCRSLLERFRNPMVEHRLEQIAIDGSQKLPIRIFATIRDNRGAGRPTRLLALVVAAWLNFLETRRDDGADLDDPLAGDLMALSGELRADPGSGMHSFLRLAALGIEELAADEPVVAELTAAWRHLHGARGDAVRARVRSYLAGGTPL